MSTAEVYDLPLTSQRLIPPSPPRAPETMSFIGRLAALRKNAIAMWGQPAYEEDIIRGRFFGHSSFILNTPDTIKHVLVDNFENYTRTPAGFRVLRPVLGEGLPPYYDSVYDRLWAACQETELPVHIHGGSGTPDYGNYGAISMLVYATETVYFAHRPLWFLIWGVVF